MKRRARATPGAGRHAVPRRRRAALPIGLLRDCWDRPGTPGGNSTRPIAAALTVAAWLVLGVAAALLLAGVIAMSAALRRITALRSPFVALAAALVINTATMTALAIVAAALPSPWAFSATALCIMAVPVAAGLAVWATLRRRAQATAPDRRDGAVYFMWGVLGLYLVADASSCSEGRTSGSPGR